MNRSHMNTPAPTQIEVSEWLHFEPETGLFVWKIRPNRKMRAGDYAGCFDDKGYRRIGFKGRPHLAHRLAWLLVYGVWPNADIDHVNGNPADNRISNLRLCTPSQNGQNRKTAKHNTSGYTGVSLLGAKWRAQLQHERKRFYLGMFDSAKDAYAAYCSAKEQMHTFQPIPREIAV